MTGRPGVPPPAEPARDVPPRGDPAPAPDRPAPDVVANSASVLSLHGEGPPLLLVSLSALSLGLLQLLLHIVESPVNPDEVEYFRATRWIADGLVPYRDFWEHHPPLHWYLLAWIAPFTREASFEGFVAMRLAQLPLLLSTLAVFFGLLRAAGIRLAASVLAAALLLASTNRSLVEIRLDASANLFLLLGLLLVERARRGNADVGTAKVGDSSRLAPRGAFTRRTAAFLAGVPLALAGLSSQRAAPLALAVLVLATFDVGTGRPRISPVGLLAGAGALATGGAAAALLATGGALGAAWEQGVRLNALYERLDLPRQGATAFELVSQLLQRPSAVAVVLLAATGIFVVARKERPLLGFAARVTATAVVAAGLLAAIRSPFPYQFQFLLWLLAALSALALDRLLRIGSRAATATSLAVLTLSLASLSLQRTRTNWDVRTETVSHQDHILRSVDRLTPDGAVVLEGCGFAVNRLPAGEEWFLPSLVRDLADAGSLARLTPAELTRRRPALVVMDSRLVAYVLRDPPLAAWIARHYLPVERFLWIPAPNGVLSAAGLERWTILKDGAYRILERLPAEGDPWRTTPFAFPFQRPRSATSYRQPLSRTVSLRFGDIRFTVDGRERTPDSKGLVRLRAGETLVAENRSGKPIELRVVPAFVPALFESPYPLAWIEPGLEF
jgi:hypothetical protein